MIATSSVRHERPRLSSLIAYAVLIGLTAFDFTYERLCPQCKQNADSLLLAITPRIVYWGVAIAILLYVRRVEGLSLASIGIRSMTRRDVAWAMGALVGGALTFAISTPVVNALGIGSVNEGIDRLLDFPIPLVLAGSVTAGVTEEIIYRGFPIERISPRRAAVALSYLIFVLGHAPSWGLAGALQIGAWTAVVTLLYVRRRNLLSCMLMHTANDIFAFVILPRLINIQA